MNDIQMQNVAIEELASVDGGGSFWGSLLIAEGTFLTCVAGGGWAGGPVGISLCGVGGVIMGGVAAAS
jgi:hypothetical protein